MSSLPIESMTPSGTSDRKRNISRCLFISRILLTATYVFGIALGLWIMVVLIRDGADGDHFAFAIAGIFVGLSIPLALHDINLHLLHYVDPLQAQVMRIIWMIPIYSLQSWIALMYHSKANYLEAMRACYESYALYSFFQLMLGATGGRERLSIRLVETGKDRAPCIAPCCCLRGWKMGNRFVHRSMVGVYQYVFINSIVAVLQLITEGSGRYNNGVWDLRYFYPYASIAINCSQMVALFVLAYFYVYTHDWLYPIKPLFKFMVIKAVIFVSWWQGLVSVANYLGMVKPFGHFSKEETGFAIQNFAICVEMFFAAIAHHYFFSYEDYYTEDPSRKTPRMELQQLNAEFDAAHAATATPGSGSLSTPTTLSTPIPKMRLPGEPDSCTESMEERATKNSTRSSGSKNSLEGGGLQSPLPDEPMGYGQALRGMMPGDVVADTGVLLKTGFGLTHKWEKRKAEEASKASLRVHEMSNLGWEAASTPSSRTSHSVGEGGVGAGLGGIAPPPVPPRSNKRMLSAKRSAPGSSSSSSNNNSENV